MADKGNPSLERKSSRPIPPKGGTSHEGASSRPTPPATTGSGAKPNKPSR